MKMCRTCENKNVKTLQFITLIQDSETVFADWYRLLVETKLICLVLFTLIVYSFSVYIKIIIEVESQKKNENCFCYNDNWPYGQQ